jgi:hypothetical protein
MGLGIEIGLLADLGENDLEAYRERLQQFAAAQCLHRLHPDRLRHLLRVEPHLYVYQEDIED